MQGYFRFGEQQILRGLLGLDVAMVSQLFYHGVEIYTSEDSKWDVYFMSIMPLSLVKPAVDIVDCYKWLENPKKLPIAYSGLDSVEEYRNAYRDWLAGGM